MDTESDFQKLYFGRGTVSATNSSVEQTEMCETSD